MPIKSFSFYGKEEDIAEAGRLLTLEIGTTHLAAFYADQNKKSLSNFELFTFQAIEANQFDTLFNTIISGSLIIKPQSATKIYVNNPFSVLVPIFKFNKEIAADYLNVVLGEDEETSLFFEHIPIEPGMMNVFRINNQAYSVLNRFFNKPVMKHSWSAAIRKQADRPAKGQSTFMDVQFYNTCITVLLVINNNLQLTQSFNYEHLNDVLYYLLNISERFQLRPSTLPVQISGMIDLEFKLYRELIKYFELIVVVEVDKNNMPEDMDKQPLHYFTPFFNLCV